MPYFTISSGLRGAYIDDSPYVIQVKTRRELKEAIAYEASIWRDGGYIGANKKAIATIAAAAWRDRKKAQLPYALPLAPEHSPRNYCHGVFVSSASRDDFLEYQKAAD
jgi:hypothetical protein